MKTFKADLHIHSCLSPCGDLDMSPKAIVERSIEKGIDIIAVCDHNSAENVGAAIRAGEQRGLCVLAGLEINSREEVHTLAVFENETSALSMQDLIYQRLKGTNRPEIFGDQVVANEFDEVEGFNDHMLIGSAEIGLQEVVKEVHRLGGLSIACHLDRPSYSIISQLGFVPPDLDLDAVEITHKERAEAVRKGLPADVRYPFVTFSDAHFLDDIGRRFTAMLLEAPNWDELCMALKEASGRRVLN